MSRNYFYILAIGLFTMAFSASAQTTKPNQKPVTQKFKPPKLYTYWGIRIDSAEITVDEVLQLVRIPLRITDDKKGVYTISSYQFLYKKRGVTENEQTGETSPTTTISSDLFRSTPLPKIWADNISAMLKKGEELTFFDVIVKDAAGRLMFAPNLHIKVK